MEQNVFESLELADRGYVLQTGRTIQQGTGKELLNTESSKKPFWDFNEFGNEKMRE